MISVSLFQIRPMDQLKEVNPDGRFWIKLDATDIKAGIFESLKGEWNGDSDLGNGELQRLRARYDHRKADCDNLFKNNGNMDRLQLEDKIREAADTLLRTDKTFLIKGLQESKEIYRVKFNAPNTPEETLKSLNWEIVEYQVLSQQCQALASQLNNILPLLNPQSPSLAVAKLRLRQLHNDVTEYLRNTFKKLRQPPADHVLVILLSDEKRSRKPYALPCSYFPYHSLNDAYVRDLTRQLKVEMKNRNLTVVGKCSKL